MNLQEIKQLIKVVEKSDIGEIEIVEEGKKIRISKNSKYLRSGVGLREGEGVQYIQQMPMSMPSAAPQPAEQKTEEKTEPPVNANLVEVKSPMVGTFYRSPAPDADPYVEVGDSVTSGQTLCIIEAMKLMNEIQAEVSGKIVKALVDNAQPVEYDQVLFLLEKR